MLFYFHFHLFQRRNKNYSVFYNNSYYNKGHESKCEPIYSGTGDSAIDLTQIIDNYNDYSTSDFLVVISSVTAQAFGHSNTNSYTATISTSFFPNATYNSETGVLTVSGCTYSSTAYDTSKSGNWTQIDISLTYKIFII